MEIINLPDKEFKSSHKDTYLTWEQNRRNEGEPEQRVRKYNEEPSISEEHNN